MTRSNQKKNSPVTDLSPPNGPPSIKRGLATFRRLLPALFVYQVYTQFLFSAVLLRSAVTNFFSLLLSTSRFSSRFIPTRANPQLRPDPSHNHELEFTSAGRGPCVDLCSRHRDSVPSFYQRDVEVPWLLPVLESCRHLSTAYSRVVKSGLRY
jgi:hypothetical protein